MTTSQRGIDLIKSFEGLCLKAVKLKGEQYYTIGYGHYGADVAANATITATAAEALLASDLKRFEAAVNALPYKMTQNQFDALVSFAYNCGIGNLRRLTDGRTLSEIPSHILYYTNSPGGAAYKQGLLRRRKAELALFMEEAKDVEQTTTVFVGSKEVKGYIKDGVTYVPLRDIVGALTSSIDISWDAVTKTSRIQLR